MAIKITEDCINCGACEIRCPNKAIYEAGAPWSFSTVAEPNIRYKTNDGRVIEGTAQLQAISENVYYIVSEKCTECVGFHDEPQCASVCPVDCCVPDPDHEESHEELSTKKENTRIRL